MDCIELAQDMDRRRELVNAIIILDVSVIYRKFIIVCFF